MKRSTSYFERNTQKHTKRTITFNEINVERTVQLSSSLSPTSKKLFETVKSDHNLIVSPAYIKKPANSIISKIFTSDFWTPTMKLQYKKLSEGKLTQSPGGKKARSPVLCIPLLEEKFKRTFDDYPKSDARNYTKVENLDKIIQECRAARNTNLRLGKDLHLKRETMRKEFMSVKKSIKLY
jgi:hypothetical protein